MIHIIYSNYLKPDGRGKSIGGIQTYIFNLLPILRELGQDVTIHQIASEDFDTQADGVRVLGHKVERGRFEKENLVKAVVPCIDITSDKVIFGCETHAVRDLKVPAIGIQHGIFWDVPDYNAASPVKYGIATLKKWKNALLTARRLSTLQRVVCVDYNFQNWFRALVPYPKARMEVIPNFTIIPEKECQKPADTVNIIFARRFFPHRGTRIFAPAMRRILDEYPQVRLTVAGTGPDEELMREHLTHPHTEFVTYAPEESMAIHGDQHITVIPTVGSEGTSLSLLEGMAAGCAPICTDVGGMTQIVLSGFNGLMVPPREEDLYLAIKRLVEDKEYRKSMAAQAFATVSSAFDYNNWRAKWRDLLYDFCNDGQN